MIVKTGRFGELRITEDEKIVVPQGILGFPDLKNYCIVDPCDDTLIVWLQSLDRPDLAFAVLEPKVFRPDYMVRLSAAELRELRLESVKGAAVFSVLTIPNDISQMTANLKAPLVINLSARIAKQVVLQENEYSIRHLMFNELKGHLLTIQSQKNARQERKSREAGVVKIDEIPPSLTVRSLQS